LAVIAFEKSHTGFEYASFILSCAAKQGGRNRIIITDELVEDGKIEPVL